MINVYVQEHFCCTVLGENAIIFKISVGNASICCAEKDMFVVHNSLPLVQSASKKYF